ncbi:tripartite tricarboxylate transporter permease [Agrobacterium pusense]|uniref:tripartite tricarboxylate transporter permease n=1 Tax=Agrobacterium pusense TaxID=648995 RepID=UPI001C6DF523|nr:tripartite tricarboxylate transporter permease [Agrobacterium pusense]MBW9060396.1 tripartite tricarboxylate transporter permease [Agrobacterium pusense]
MEILSNLALGFETALTIQNLVWCFVGVLLGTLVGVLPGIGPTATIAMLLPITFSFSPVTALIMLSGIYYGAQYGGSTTAILINLPGESSSAVTAIDGYQMARQGRAGAALATAALGSFFAGCVATMVLAVAAPPLTRVALNFGPAEYFALLVLGLLVSISLAHGSVLKALAMIVLGLLLGSVGQDVTTGTPRYTMGFEELYGGINFVSLAVGMFGVAEIFRNLETDSTREVGVKKVTRLWLSKAEFKRVIGPVLRGTGIGSILGILPGGGHVLASFASYSAEKNLSKTPKEFGQGAIEGVAGPESANNAAAQTSFIPLLTLGIPTHPVMALIVGAFILQGITPGPNVINEQPALFWGIIASMWIGNFLLVILNLPLIGLWVKMLTIPYRFLFPAIVIFASIGCYSINNNPFDVYAIIAFGILGYVLSRFGCEPAPLLLGFVLGPLLEENLRRAMIISRGDPTVFLTRPLAATLLAFGFACLMFAALPAMRRRRQEIFIEDD